MATKTQWGLPILAAVLTSCLPEHEPFDPLGDADTDADADTDTDTDVDTDAAPTASVSASGVVTCADPNARDERRFDVKNAFEMPLDTDTGYTLIGGGLAVGDLDGDGLLDLLMPSELEIQVWMQQAGVDFVDEADPRVAGIELGEATAASLADFDGDGDLDAYISRWDERDTLLVNDGAGQFSDGTAAAGLDGTLGPSVGASWADFDRDGDLDLFVASYGAVPDEAYVDSGDTFEVGTPSHLFRNEGNGTFTDISDAMLPTEVQEAQVFIGGWQDLDADGWPELLTVHDFGWNRPSQLLWNVAGDLVPDDGTAGWAIPFAGMGLAIGDVNADAVPDMAQSSWKDFSLLTSSGGVWYEQQQARLPGLPSTEDPDYQIFGWGTELADMDLDGDLDLVVGYGHWDDFQGTFREQHDGLYLQDGGGTFTDEAADWELDDDGVTRGLVVADLNDDGWPDVMKRALDATTKMYLSRCGDGQWLRFRLHDPNTANRFAVGARLELSAGGETQHRWIHAGSTGLFTGGPPEALFGLDGATVVDTITVTWPDGVESELTGIASRQTIDVTRL